MDCKGRRDGICGWWTGRSKWACKEVFGFGGGWGLGRGMGEGGKEGGKWLAVDCWLLKAGVWN